MSKQSTSEQHEEKQESKASIPVKKMCGVIMPIADTAGYGTGHWNDVLNILKDALSNTQFEAKLVSERIDIGLIHEEIVKNIYENEIVICDVSSKNPNVMFELGMRLAFDKPTIIIKDERDNFTFDIGGIFHLEYPSSLRHNKIENFKVDLSKHVLATYEKSINNKDYSPFLKSFSKTTPLIPSKLTSNEVPINEYISGILEGISSRLSAIERKGNIDSSPQLTARVYRRGGDNIIKQIKNFLEDSYKIGELQKMVSDEVFKEQILNKIKNLFNIKLSQTGLTNLVIEILNEDLR